MTSLSLTFGGGNAPPPQKVGGQVPPLPPLFRRLCIYILTVYMTVLVYMYGYVTPCRFDDSPVEVELHLHPGFSLRGCDMHRASGGLPSGGEWEHGLYPRARRLAMYMYIIKMEGSAWNSSCTRSWPLTTSGIIIIMCKMWQLTLVVIAKGHDLVQRLFQALYWSRTLSLLLLCTCTLDIANTLLYM